MATMVNNTSESPTIIPPARLHGTNSWRRFVGYFHYALIRFSTWHCRVTGLKLTSEIYPLPFNLLIKCTPRTSEEEFVAMRAARALGLPVPRALSFAVLGRCYSKYGDTNSILMTRLPGVHLTLAWDTLSAEQKDGVRDQLGGYLRIMRRARSPYGPSRICSLSGGPVFSPRVPLNFVGPYDDEEQFHKRLLQVASPIGYSGPSYEDTLALAGSIRHDHDIVLTHGDLVHWNILVHNGRISGIVDWETAGWLPDYWEYAAMLRIDLVPGDWWGPFVRSLEGFHYERERESDAALLWITSSSF